MGNKLMYFTIGIVILPMVILALPVIFMAWIVTGRHLMLRKISGDAVVKTVGELEQDFIDAILPMRQWPVLIHHVDVLRYDDGSIMKATGLMHRSYKPNQFMPDGLEYRYDVYITNAATMSVKEYAKTLAHELRHVWQYETGSELLCCNNNTKYVNADDNYREYLLQPCEIDAREFADKFIEREDIIKLMIDIMKKS